ATAPNDDHGRYRAALGPWSRRPNPRQARLGRTPTPVRSAHVLLQQAYRQSTPDVGRAASRSASFRPQTAPGTTVRWDTSHGHDGVKTARAGTRRDGRAGRAGR